MLILGARGMLGSALTRLGQKYAPIAWDKETVDLTDSQALTEKISQLQPDYIINAAAYTNVDGAESDSRAAFAVNERAVHVLATVAKEMQVTLIHYSTDYVFPGDKDEGYVEDDKPGPAINVYGTSKLAGERALQTVAPRFYLIRTAWLYGPGGKNFVDTMLHLAKDHSSLKVVNDQHGSPTFTFDVARATYALLAENYQPGIYHLVNSGMTTWYDFARHIFTAVGTAVTVQPIPSEQYPLPARRPQYSKLNNTKGPGLRSWEAALDEYLKKYYIS